LKTIDVCCTLTKGNVFSEHALFKLNGLLSLGSLFFFLLFRALKASIWLLSQHVLNFVLFAVVTQVLGQISSSGFSIHVFVY
jgi:hypothetical protein